MLAVSALKLSQQDTFAKRLKAAQKTVLNTIKIVAKSGSVSITIPAEKTWTKDERCQLYALLIKDGYSVAERIIPNSKIEPDRKVVDIKWGS